MKVALLDVNVLIALLDRRHVHHEPAHGWFAHPRPAALSKQSGAAGGGGPFDGATHPPPAASVWPDSLSLLGQSGVDVSRLLEAGQLTDTYLLALAVNHDGQLVTFDRRLSCEGVAGGREALWLIDP